MAFFLLIGGVEFMCKVPRKKEFDLKKLLPEEIRSWRTAEEDKVYDPETIFDYIDGAGEIYRSFHFKTLLARHFTKEGQPGIYADLFDMQSSKNAFGIFTHDLEGEDAGIGQGSTYKGGLLSFWKGQFFASLFSEEETEEAKKALLDLGKWIDSAIEREGEKPWIVSLFPAENLYKGRIHYFTDFIILNYHFFVADENILLLNEKTDAALGIYRYNEENSYLLLVRYPEEKRATVAYKSFIQTFMPDAKENGLVETEDSKWTAARKKGKMLMIIFAAPSASLAEALLDRVERKL